MAGGMTLEKRMFLIIALVMTAAFVSFEAISYRHLEKRAEAELLTSAERVRNVVMAMRRVYQHQFLDSGIVIDEKTIGLFPAAALSKISEELHNWDNSGFSLNTVSDRPRNPRNLADRIELSAIEHFREHRDQQLRFISYRDDEGRTYYHYARPIWVEPYCLNCHGDRDKAPPGIRTKYEAAYDYKVGELRGILSIKVPADRLRQDILREFGRHLLWHLGLFVLLSLATAWAIRRYLGRPLARLHNNIGAIAGGNLAARVETLPGELDQIGKAFNDMVETLQKDRDSLAISEERFRSIAASAADAIVVIDAAGTILFWNEGAEKMLARTAAEMLGTPVSRIIPERYRPAHLAGMAKAGSGPGKYLGSTQDLMAVHKNGHEVPVAVSLSGWQGTAGPQFAAIMRDITLSKLQEDELRRIAYHDPLTHLPNRLLFFDRMQLALAQTERSGCMLAICYLDLDGFKSVNDTHGHETGDHLLKEAAQRLRDAVRAGDTVARLGGDEFGLLLGELSGIEEVEQTLNRVLSVIAVPYLVDGYDLTLSASIGVTLLPDGDKTPEHLLRQADEAMYRAKAAGCNCFRLFDTAQNQAMHRYREELERIRSGFDHGEFHLRYVPTINIRHCRVAGLEAVLFWQHPEEGLLLPARFAASIEESDLAVTIGKWAVEQALRQCAAWSKDGLDIPVSINISPKCLQEKSLAGWIGEMLRNQPDLKPGSFGIEVTEEHALAQTACVGALLEEGHPLGLRVVLDGFGVAYTSLTYLKRLGVDEIKIAPSLVEEVLGSADVQAVVRGIIGLGHAFGLAVIAEGLTEPEQGMLLAQYDCDIVQDAVSPATAIAANDVPAWLAAFDPAVKLSEYMLLNTAEADVPLLAARVAHRQWLRRLLDYLDDKDDQAGRQSPGDHRRCRLGQWYENAGKARYGHLPAFLAIEPVHREFHQVANDIVVLKQAGDLAGARKRVEELRQLSSRIVAGINDLLLEAAIAGGR